MLLYFMSLVFSATLRCLARKWIFLTLRIQKQKFSSLECHCPRKCLCVINFSLPVYRKHSARVPKINHRGGKNKFKGLKICSFKKEIGAIFQHSKKYEYGFNIMRLYIYIHHISIDINILRF